MRVASALALSLFTLPVSGQTLYASSAIAVDAETGEVLIKKNVETELPIASITKVMTALITVESNASLDELIKIDPSDRRHEFASGRKSILKVGKSYPRREVLHLTLSASDNLAAHALARSYSGGYSAFMEAMNLRALEMNLLATQFRDPSGISADNKSTVSDLAELVRVASKHAIIRELSSTPTVEVENGGKKPAVLNNTNVLIRDHRWDIELSKTGFTSKAGTCLVMLTQVVARKVVIVLLHAPSKLHRQADAEAIRVALGGDPPPKPIIRPHKQPEKKARKQPRPSKEELRPHKQVREPQYPL